MTTETHEAQPSPRPVIGPLPDDRPWRAEEVAYYLGISPRYVRKLEQRGQLPALPRIGARVNWDPAIVKQFRQNPEKFKKAARDT